MEIDDVLSDLNALKKLYALTQISADGVQVKLDERARCLLKCLLDGAAERLLESHLKIVAASCSSKVEQTKDLPNSQLPVSTGILGTGTSIKPLSNSVGNGYSFNRQSEELLPTKPTIPEVSENGNKRCLICRQNVMQQNSSINLNEKRVLLKPVETDSDLVTSKNFLFCEIHRNPSIVSSIASPERSPSTIENYQSKAECNIANKVPDTIQQIETGISALQLCSELRVGDSLKISDGGLNDTATSVMQMKKELPRGNDSSNQGGIQATRKSHIRLNSTLQNHDTSNLVPCKSVKATRESGIRQNSTVRNRDTSNLVPCKSVKAFVQRMESLSQLASQNPSMISQTPEYVHGLRVPTIGPDCLPEKRAVSRVNSNISRSQMDNKALIRKEVNLGQTNLPPLSSVWSTSSYGAVYRKKNPSHQIVMKPPLLNHREFNSSESPSASRNSSASWTTEETNISRSTRETASKTESEGNSLPSRAPQKRFRVSNESGTESGTGTGGGSTSYSSQSLYTGLRSTKTYSSPRQRNPTKAIGKLRRLKNKLGLIFHHHHHHHHHHPKSAQASMWNNLQNIFHHSNKKSDHNRYGNLTVDKLRKSTVTSNIVPSKQQMGHFRALVEGLMRHTRNSKPIKCGIGRDEKIVKKSNWWHVLPNKGRVKLGFINKKSQPRGQIRHR